MSRLSFIVACFFIPLQIAGIKPFPYNEAIMNLLIRFLTPSAIVFSIAITLCFSWLILLLALFGLFSSLLVSALTILYGASFLLVFIFFFHTRDWYRFFLVSFLTLLVLWITLSRDPSVFTGRDQGSIAEAAYRLAANHQLTFTNDAVQTFFDIYGPGTALNFPGFAYTENGSLITQFPLGYTSWLAAFITLFGLPGYALGNSILFILFGWGLFELLALRISKTIALGGTLLGSLAFLPLWMSTYTLSENFAVVLFVFLSLSFFALLETPHQRTLVILLLIASFFPFVRIEGFVFFVLILGFILWKSDMRKLLLGFPKKYAIFAAVLWVFVFFRDFFMNLPFYKMIGKALLKRINEHAPLGGTISGTDTESLGLIFSHYGLLILFVGALLASICFVRYRDRFPLWILFLAAPTLLYFLIPSITPDHPWMLRRFFFTLYPTAIFLLVTSIWTWSSRSSFIPSLSAQQKSLLILGCFFLSQAIPTLTVFRITENPGLLQDTRSFGTQFDQHDLILIDRESTGDPHSLVSGPLSFLENKQAVYLFNPLDLDRIDRNRFKTLYLLSPAESLGQYAEMYGERLIPIETVTFTSKKLKASRSFFARPFAKTTESVNVLFEIAP